MKKHITAKQRDWVEGNDVAVRVTTVEVPMIDVRATRRRLGLSQGASQAEAEANIVRESPAQL